MAQQPIDIGTTANDGTGDQLRDAFDKTNQNTTELYADIASINAGDGTVVRRTVPATAVGASGDLAGMIATDGTDVWVCTADYDGATDIWLLVNPAEVNNLASAVTWASVPDAYITEASVTQHEAALTVTESQISDLRDAGVMKATVPTLPHGVAGDAAGMIAADASFLYICIADYVDDLTVSWHRIALPAPSSATVW